MPLRLSWNDARRRATRAWSRIYRKRKQIDIRAAEVPIAMMIIGAYYGFYLTGDLVMRVAPRTMVKHFRI